MELIPAVDILDGRVVRLVKGDFDRKTRYGDDPVAMAQRWESEGAPRLHLVDLDGAREGRPVQRAVVARIVAAVGIPCQVAGGLRDREAVASALQYGADRVVLGTAILEDPRLAEELVDAFGAEHIVAALDVRGREAVGEGWRRGAVSVPWEMAMRDLRAKGIRRFVVTAIARDGQGTGPDTSLVAEARLAAPDAAIIASGGISTLDDIRALADLGMEAAILGRSLYDGTLHLPDALAATDGQPRTGSLDDGAVLDLGGSSG